MGYLLDTCIWSALIRRAPLSLVGKVSALHKSDVYLSPIVWGELLLGYYKGDRRPQRDEVLRQIAANALPIVVDHAVSRRYAQIRAQLELAGTPIGRNDTWIAAEALHHGLTVVTDNTEEFSRVEGLKVENWMV